MTALRHRFLRDLQLAGLAERTCEAYVRAVRQLAHFYNQSPHKLSEAQVRDYFSHIKNQRHFARGSLTIAYSGIKFFFRRTVPRNWKTLEGLRVPPEKKLPDVLTVDEVRRIIAAVRSEPCRACLWTIYSLGLRLSEGVSLHVGDVDALEFLRRFLQHVLPPGLQKVRHYGFLSPQSTISLDDVRALVAIENAAARDAIATAPRALDTSWITALNAITEPTCPHCRHRLRLVEILFHRVSFRDSG